MIIYYDVSKQITTGRIGNTSRLFSNSCNFTAKQAAQLISAACFAVKRVGLFSQ